ncbi:MAG: hypothetical protein JNK94_09930 [Hyphomonadaceae bacterium]|nr:hypothetical protein [Hyphomonadaceae bacterium]
MSDLVAWYCGLNQDEQLRANLSAAYWITLAAREPERDLEALRRLNELQHKIIEQSTKLLSRDPDRYPDQFFAEMVIEGLEQAALDASRAFAA